MTTKDTTWTAPDGVATWCAFDALAHTLGRLEAVGVCMCGEPWRKLWARDRDAAIRALLQRIEAEAHQARAFAAQVEASRDA
jgi:hypothetical protein